MAASLLVLASFLGVAEVLARAAGPVVPEWQLPDNPGVLMNGHPTRLWGMGVGVRPNVGSVATIEANGLRAPVPGVPRPAGRSRVLVVGDSTFFGHGVADDETIPHYVAAQLVALGVDADAVNGAIPGYSTEQTRVLLDEVGWASEPTLLLIGSLWSDSNVDGFRDADLLRSARLYRENPLGRSAFFRLAVAQVDRARGGDGARMVTWTKESTWPDSDDRRVPLREYAANLDGMARDARARGIGVAFLAPVNRFLLDDPSGRAAGWDPYFAAQKAVGAWHGVPVVSARSAFERSGAESADLFVDRMHPSPLGARAIAGEVAADLVAAGWPGNVLLARPEPFDESSLVDDAKALAGHGGMDRSPQSHLFPGLRSAVEAMGAPSPPVGPPLVPGWELNGMVAPGSAPVDLLIERRDGRPIRAFRVPVAGPFAVPVEGAETAVTVVANGGEGQTRVFSVELGGPDLLIAFGQPP